MPFKYGFIGLGQMGAPMAANLLNTFGTLVVFNRSQAPCLALQQKGATVASDIRDVSAHTDVICLALPGPAEVQTVVAGQEGLIASGRSGQTILDFSTVSPAQSRDLSRLAAEKGLNYIDIPVSGGGMGATKATLSLMIGASKDEIEALGLKPCLLAIGKTFHFMGFRGGGSAIKIINNFLSFTAQVMNGEAILMAEHLGIPLETFYEVVMSSSGNNAILGAKKEKMLKNDLSPGFVVDLVLKDLELARQLCQDSGIANFTLNTGIQFYRMAQQHGFGKSDSSSVIRMIRDLEPLSAEMSANDS